MINIKLVKLLLAICAGLALVILLEWLYAMYAQKQLLDSINALDKQKTAASRLPSIELQKTPETGYVDLVNRPLFIQGRKPVKETSGATQTAVSTATENFNWDLNGIYTQNNRLYALFRRSGVKAPKDNYRKITKDGNIDGWILTEIHKDKVVFTQGGKQKELPLRKSKPKDAVKHAETQNVPGIPTQQGFPQGNYPPNPPQQQPQQVPVPEPMPEPVPQPVIEPELIPDDSSEPNFENSDEAQY